MEVVFDGRGCEERGFWMRVVSCTLDKGWWNGG